MKKCTKKFLLVGLAAILTGMLISCGEPVKKEPKQEPVIKDGLKNPYEGEDVLGTVSENLLDDGDADECEGEISFSGWGSVKTKVDGGVSGKAWKIVQNSDDGWSELGVDLTSLYGQGKSYLISAKVKNDPEGEHKDAQFFVAWTLYSGDVKNWCDENNYKHYDFPENKAPESIVGPWGGDFDEDGEAFGISDLNKVTELTDEWQELKLIIPSTNIEEKVNNSGVYEFQISLYAGDEGPAGYSFLIDDVCIQDLNSELKRHGQTWVDPNAEEEAEEPEDTEEEEEE